MSLRELVAEVAELCGHEDFSTAPVDLSSLGVKDVHVSAKTYFEECVPTHFIDRPFYQLLAASDVVPSNTEYVPSLHILSFGFVTFANEPNGDVIAVDATDGRVYLVSHECFTEDGILDYEADDPIPITRESILAKSENTFPSISAFFESWRNRLTEQQHRQDAFIEAALRDPNATDEFGNTLIVHFIREGDLKMVKHEVKRGVNLEQFNLLEKRTPLGEAISFGHPDIVEYLVECGVNVNAADDSGTTPLMLAAHYSQLECARILLKAGASRTATDSIGRTALDRVSVIHGTPAMKELLTP